MLIEGRENVELFGLLILRKRLELEIETPFKDKRTLIACKRRGFAGKTRKKALEWINELLRPFDDAKRASVPGN